jgi:integrase
VSEGLEPRPPGSQIGARQAPRAGQTGKPIDRSKLLKRFKAALARADVRAVRFHDLRHTFGARMAAQGMPMRVLQELMGHGDFKTTPIYADYAPSEREAKWVEEAFRSAIPAIETARAR